MTLILSLLIAQSCVGEAGFRSWESGECAAIAYVYLKRAELSGQDINDVVRQYSAAIKPGIGKPWVRNLRRDAAQPKGWPTRLCWSQHADDWKSIMRVTDDFVAGVVMDPLPNALHYGGHMDRNRLDPRVWIRIMKPGCRNMFYRRVR